MSNRKIDGILNALIDDYNNLSITDRSIVLPLLTQTYYDVVTKNNDERFMAIKDDVMSRVRRTVGNKDLEVLVKNPNLRGDSFELAILDYLRYEGRFSNIQERLVGY